jgi:hypothetical protein
MSANKHLDAQAIHAAWLANDRSYECTATQLGIGETSVRRHVKKIEGAERVEKTKDAELTGLRQQVKSLEKRILTDARVESEIMKLAAAPIEPPEWLTRVKAKKEKFFAGVPTFFASDWHFGEVVRPAEIGGLNEYNVDIATKRAATFVNVGIELLRDHMPRSKYDGCVLALGGDMVSGDIHDELAQTNEIESIPAVLKMTGLISEMIERLADEFGRVFIPCVTGNHGRTSRKPRMKRRNHTNFDWLLYNMLAMQFVKDKRVTFQIPEGPDAYFRVYNTRYLLTHGDQFRGGDGMIGAIGPIFRGDKKKRARNAETEFSYDVIMMGHWHQYIHLAQLIVNGALKGYDEFAFAGNFGFEPAQQALWVTNPEHGITFRMPVYVQRRAKGETVPWVSVKS